MTKSITLEQLSYLSATAVSIIAYLFVALPSGVVCMAKHWTQVQEQISAVIEPCD